MACEPSRIVIAESLDEEVAHFIGEVMQTSDFATTVADVVQFACTTLGTIHGGVTLMRAGGKRFETVGETSELVCRADEKQYELREGPCVSAAETAHLFAFHASAALAAARNEEGLRQALDTRLLIGQAQGILMERFGLQPEQAFAVLRRLSQHGNLKLHDVARQLVDTRALPTSASDRGEGARHG